ncbi:MAG TPA: hypothetical protein VJ546_10215, partial [Bacillales bacterium]|nr:hypothetical protein [Bacillales bacterium]
MEILGFHVPFNWILVLAGIPVTFIILFLILSRLVGGMGAAMIFGGFMRIIGVILKIIFGGIAWILRKLIFKTKDYTGDQNNETIIWNLQAIFFLALNLIFLFATPSVLIGVYEYQREGWLFLPIIGFFSFLTGPKIANAPIFKKIKFIKEWRTAIVLFITGLATSSS